jgi:hypothetical protein
VLVPQVQMIQLVVLPQVLSPPQVPPQVLPQVQLF